MRVGVDVTPLTPGRTGVGEYTFQILRHLAGLEGAPELVGLSTGRGGGDPAALGLLALHRHLPVPTRLMYRIWQGLRMPTSEALLGRHAVFHGTNYFLPPTRAARRVVTIYDLSFLRFPHLSSPRIVGPFSRLVGCFARDADAVLVCSRATARDVEELLDVPAARVRVAHGAVSPGMHPPAPEEARACVRRRLQLDGPYILFVGTLEPRKNLDTLAQAFAALSSRTPHQLVLAGGMGWKMEEFGARLESLGVRGRTRLLGYVDPAVLPALYAAASVFAFPSHYEGFGLPVLEAMACGCPVVASNTSSLPEVAGDAALCVDPADVGALAGAMLRLIEDESLRARSVELGYRRAQAFSWEASARVTLDMYRSLAE